MPLHSNHTEYILKTFRFFTKEVYFADLHFEDKKPWQNPNFSRTFIMQERQYSEDL